MEFHLKNSSSIEVLKTENGMIIKKDNEHKLSWSCPELTNILVIIISHELIHELIRRLMDLFH